MVENPRSSSGAWSRKLYWLGLVCLCCVVIVANSSTGKLATAPRALTLAGSPVGSPPAEAAAILDLPHIEERAEIGLGPPGADPVALVYDNYSERAFLSLAPSYVSELEGTPPRVVQTADLGANSNPSGIAYDPLTNAILVGTEPGGVTVISASNLSIVGVINVGYQPASLVYDPVTGDVYAGGDAQGLLINPGAANLTDINGSSYALTNITDSLGPILPAILEFDSATGLVVAAGLDGLTGADGIVAFNTTNRSAVWVHLSGTSTTYSGMTIDPRTGRLFLPEGATQSAAVLNGFSGASAGSISLGSGQSESLTVQFGSACGCLVVGHANETLQVVNASGVGPMHWFSTNGEPSFTTLNETSGSFSILASDSSVVTSLSANGTEFLGDSSVGSGPTALAYDSIQNLVYVAGSSNVSVISTTTNSVITSIPTGADPQAVLFDPRNDTVYVANTDNQSITVISSVSNQVVATVHVDPDPFALAWDNTSNEVYVACLNYSGTKGFVDVLSPSNYSVLARISTGPGSPDGLAFVPELNELFVSETCIVVCYPPSNLTVISTLTNQILTNITLPQNVTFTPGQIMFDGMNGELYVAGSGFTLNSAYPYDVVIDPYNESVIASITVGPGPYGLAAAPAFGSVFATSWLDDTVDLLNSTSNVVTEVFHASPASSPEGVVWDPIDNEAVVANWGSDSVTILDLIQSYPVSFVESGLPPGTEWAVNLSGQTLSSTESSIDFTEPNGTYWFSVTAVPGYNVSPANGMVVVSGATVAEYVTYDQEYAVQFVVTGLPAGTTWGVSLSSVLKENLTTPTGGALTFEETNGSFSYVIEGLQGFHQNSLPYNGIIRVDGSNLTEPLSFGLVEYRVLFTEIGLPSGTEWNVTFNGVENTSIGSPLQFSEPNGTYGYIIGRVPGWHPSTSKWVGSVVISGGGLTEVLSWIQTTYTVSFQEAGLPNGTNWMLTVAGEVSNSHSQFIQVQLTNGSYSFQVLSVQGYTSTPPAGVIRVTGQNMTESIQFATAAATASGLSPLLWTLAVLGAGLTLAALVFVYLARRRRQGRGGATRGSLRSGVA